MLRKRIITAICGIPILCAAVWFEQPVMWFTVLATVWGALAVLEFYSITGVSRTVPLLVFGVIWTMLFLLGPQLGFPLPLLLTSAVVLSLILAVLVPHQEEKFTTWAWTIAGILYVGWLLSYLVILRLEAGLEWVFLALLATFGSDIAAFFIGRALGRHKLAPDISPGKTWEGAFGGLLGAVIVSLLFTLPTPLQLPIGWGQAIILGIFISVFGQLGDLAESLLKRNSGVKESGNLMPGHGGLLDRMDSVVFAGVAVYFYFIIM
jgi:phosphatidate cytidylyltransferase